MNRENKNNWMISFAGLCGVGKTTMRNMLSNYLIEKGITTETVELLHSIVPQNKILIRTSKYLKQKNISNCDRKEYKEIMDAMSLVLSFELNAIPAIERNQVVIFDRYIDNYVNGELVSEHAKELLNSLPVCDLRFYLTCDLDIALERVRQRGRKMQSDLESAQEKCYQYHENIVKTNPGFYTIINSERPVEEVFREVAEKVDQLIWDTNHSKHMEK